MGGGLRLAVVCLVISLTLVVAPTAPDDYTALRNLYDLTNGTYWREGFTWTFGFDNNYDPCDDTDFFKGLACSGNPGDADRKVTQIWLSAMMLNGTLPEDIGMMNKMVQLYLMGNELSGPIPESICNMTSLEFFEVSQNRLNGSIPNCIGGLTVLQKWESRGNSLSGTIPAAFGSLPVLQGLFLSDNRLSGTIPSELFNAKRIEQLLLSYNDLEGTVPKIFSRYKIKETPSMQGLSWMDTRSNKLQGTYPDIMALLAAV